ncbi:MAG: hypothetical protein ACTSRE_00110 [Promethearchaeota archaeon]
MSSNETAEFTTSTNAFMKFIENLFVTSSEDISDVLISKSTEIIYTSEWKGENVISELLGNWQKYKLTSTLSIQGMKFIKLHDSPFNLIYRSIQRQKALIGAKFPIQGEEMQAFALITQTSMMQLQSQALKDIIETIIKLGQKATDVVIVDPTTIRVSVNFPDNKQSISIFLQSLKSMHFSCDYKDKGDAIEFTFKYKKEEKKVYSDEVYKQYLKKS